MCPTPSRSPHLSLWRGVGRRPGEGEPSRGFTLLELVVAIAVASVLLAIAVPRLHALVPAFEIDRAARLLAIDLERTRWLAIARNSRARIVVDLAAGSYAAEIDGGTGFVGVFARDLASGIAFDSSASTRIAGGHITLVFEPRGHTATSGTVAIGGRGDLRRRVIVNSAGRVRIAG